MSAKSSEQCQAVLAQLTEASKFQEPIVASLTMSDLARIVAGAFTGVTCLLCLIMVMLHMKYYARPNEQRQIIRCLLVPPLFAVFALISVCCYTAAPYLGPIPKILESFGLCFLFLLVVEYAIPGLMADPRGLRNTLRQIGRGDTWFKQVWALVYQYPVITIFLTIGEEVVVGTVCPSSTSYTHKKAILNVIGSVSTTIAIIAIIRFHRRTKSLTQDRPVVRQLFCFKAMVTVAILTLTIFSFLSKKFLTKVSSKMTYLDWIIAVPALAIEAEMVLFALLFCWGFSPSPYIKAWKNEDLAAGSRINPSQIHGFRALVDVCDFRDFFRGLVVAFESHDEASVHDHVGVAGVKGVKAEQHFGTTAV